MINVLIVDDHPVVSEGTKAIIEKEVDMKARIILDSSNVIKEIEKEKIDIYLLDLYMPEINGIELTKLLLKVDPDAIVLIYTGFEILPHYNIMMEVGVAGFISKAASQEQLITAIRCALREEVVVPLPLLKQLRRIDARPTNEGQQHLGEIILTNKEQEILLGVSKGLTNKAIAAELYMSQRTIEYHLTKIFTKLKVGSRTEALIKAQEYGLMPQDLAES